MIGQTVSHYRVLSKLGGGGMGVVYEAEDLKLGRRVALKFLPEELGRDAQALERLQREARAASSLKHPNICTIYDVDEHEGQPFIAMELLEGETLRDRLGPGPAEARHAARPRRPDRRRARGRARAGHRAPRHQAGEHLRHEARPGEAARLRPGQARGRARRRSGGDTALPTAMAEEHLTSPGTAIGTVAYMSPEQARGEPLDARTDLFSCGAVLYEMATGRQPFAGKHVGRHLRRDPEPRAGLAGQAQPGAAGRARAHRQHRAREGPGPALPERRRAEDGPEAPEARLGLGTQRQDRGRAAAAGAADAPAAMEGPGRRRRASSLAAGAAVWWATHRRASGAAAPAARRRSPSSPSRTSAATPSTDYLRLALPDEIATTLSYIPTLAIRPFAVDAEVRRRGTSTRRPPDGAAGRRRPDRPLPEGGRPAPRHARGHRHGVEPPPLARHLERRRGRPDRPARTDLGAPAPGPLPAARRRGRRRPRPRRGRRTPRPTTSTCAASPSRATRSRTSRAIAMLERSVGLDPDYAPAWAALSLRYYYQAYSQGFGSVGRRQQDQGSLRPCENDRREGALPRPQPRRSHPELHRLRDRGRQPRGGRPKSPGPRLPPSAGPPGALRARLRPAIRGTARGGRPGMRRRPGRWTRTTAGSGPAPSLFLLARKVRARAGVPAPGRGVGLVEGPRGQHPPPRGQDRGSRRPLRRHGIRAGGTAHAQVRHAGRSGPDGRRPGSGRPLGSRPRKPVLRIRHPGLDRLPRRGAAPAAERRRTELPRPGPPWTTIRSSSPIRKERRNSPRSAPRRSGSRRSSWRGGAESRPRPSSSRSPRWPWRASPG